MRTDQPGLVFGVFGLDYLSSSRALTRAFKCRRAPSR